MLGIQALPLYETSRLCTGIQKSWFAVRVAWWKLQLLETCYCTYVLGLLAWAGYPRVNGDVGWVGQNRARWLEAKVNNAAEWCIIISGICWSVFALYRTRSNTTG